MKNLMMAGALVLSLTATGCATKKYVTRTVNDTVAPVEARVTAGEGKNANQDTQLATNSQEIDQLQTGLSRSNERIADADSKATAAGTAAQRANEAATAAQRSAEGAQTTADAARVTGERAITRANEVQTSLERKMDAINKYQMAESETILFPLNQYKLDADAKAKLDAIAARATSNPRYVIEVQGFTDKTGSADSNTVLSQRRAEAVTRYLINEHKIALRNIEAIGSGYALPVADDATRDGRKMNRRVEVRVFVPEMPSAATIAGNE
jgi:outer membrane protein OmpA-like peptidoglycan-associated protein